VRIVPLAMSRSCGHTRPGKAGSLAGGIPRKNKGFPDAEAVTVGRDGMIGRACRAVRRRLRSIRRASPVVSITYRSLPGGIHRASLGLNSVTGVRQTRVPHHSDRILSRPCAGAVRVFPDESFSPVVVIRPLGNADEPVVRL
jgi:hypothetical protein